MTVRTLLRCIALIAKVALITQYSLKRELRIMSEKRDLQAEKDMIEHIANLHNGQKHEKTYLETIAIHAIDRAIDAEKKLGGLIQALYDFPVPDASKSTAIELIAWIESTCPWLEEVPDEQN
jgi:hypothetical protein